MEIVLDTNVLIASLLKNGLTRKIVFLSLKKQSVVKVYITNWIMDYLRIL